MQVLGLMGRWGLLMLALATLLGLVAFSSDDPGFRALAFWLIIGLCGFGLSLVWLDIIRWIGRGPSD